MKNLLNKKTQIVSLSSGKQKTIGDLISKFLERGEISVRNWEMKLVRCTSYGDADYMLRFELNSTAQMSTSPAVTIDGVLPLHVDYAGKVTLGFGCGASTSEEPSAKFWKKRRNQERKLRRNCYFAIYASSDGQEWSEEYDCVFALQAITARTNFNNPFWKRIGEILAEVGQRQYFLEQRA